MSKKAIVQLYKNEEFKEELMATTNHQEIIRIGQRKGLKFTKSEFEEVKQAASDFKNKIDKEVIRAKNQDLQKKELNTRKSILVPPLKSSRNKLNLLSSCYEFDMREIQGFELINNEIKKIKIKPNAVDLNCFNNAFRSDDFNFTSISPASEKFQAQYDEVEKLNNSVDVESFEPRYLTHRNFHLINLDAYVDGKHYEDYFQSKVKIVKTLKNFFEADVKLSGSFWYPPNAYRLWHTNEKSVGWRMYLIDFDQPELAASGKSFFRYMHPETKELVTLVDKPKLVRFFKIDDQPEHLLWHCIVNGTKASRWSYGFHVPDNWMEKIKIQ